MNTFISAYLKTEILKKISSRLVAMLFFAVAEYASAQTFSVATSINSNGTFTGASSNSPDPSQATAFTYSLHGNRYRNLGTLGGPGSAGLAINDAGIVVGNADTAMIDPASGGNISHAFLANSAGMHDLGTLPGDIYSQANGVNERGDVAGFSTPGAPGTPYHAFLYRRGVMTDIGNLGGGSAVAQAINDRGDIIGNSTTLSGTTHAFLWRNGVMTDLGTLGGTFSNAISITSAGQIVGVSRKVDSSRHVFLWEHGQMRDLGIPVNFSFQPFLFVRDCGSIVGGYAATSGSIHAFISQRHFVDLGTLGGENSEATSMNTRGQIVGSSDTASGELHAFLSDGSHLHDMDSVLH